MTLDKIITLSEKSLIKYAGKKAWLGSSEHLFWWFGNAAFLFTFFAAITLPKKIITPSRKRNLSIVRLSNPAMWVFGQLQTLLCTECSAVPLFPQTLPVSPLTIRKLFQISSIFLHAQRCLFPTRWLMGRVWLGAKRKHFLGPRPSARQVGPTQRVWRSTRRGTETLKTLLHDLECRDIGKAHKLCLCRHQDNKQVYDYLDLAELMHGFRSKLL